MNPYEILSEILNQEDVSLYGWTLLQQPLSLSLYSDWLAKNYNGSMHYLNRHEEIKSLSPFSKNLAYSAIVVGINYVPNHPQPWNENPIPNLHKAAYSEGKDYHYWMSEKLKKIVTHLQNYYPEEQFQIWIDSGPVLERDLAYRSGLGWVGKNTCLINKKQGSFFLIGEIYTSLKLENTNALMSDFCGKCSRCIDSCPTGAIENHRVLNANKCISYWTIESKDIPNIDLRKKFGDWLFGCDICQNVCPWNQIHLTTKKQESELHFEKSLNAEDAVVNELRWILQSSNKELQRALAESALERGAGFKLKRNAIIVIANLKIKILKPEVLQYSNDPRLTELIKWCLNEIEG